MMIQAVDLYSQIVADLEMAGRESLYRADANEPDPRYKSYGVRAEGQKKIIRAHRKAIRTLNQSEQIALAKRLIQSRYGEQQRVGLFILEPLAAYFVPERFDELDGLVRCLHGWSKIDGFSGTLLRDILFQYPLEMAQWVRQWNQDSDMWLRRASVVLFTRQVARSGQFNDFALEMCHNLIHDPELLVQKGVGWALKDLMRSDKPRLIETVKSLRAQGVASVITLYAIKDLKAAERADILKITRVG